MYGSLCVVPSDSPFHQEVENDQPNEAGEAYRRCRKEAPLNEIHFQDGKHGIAPS